jgi:hypothetical protein
MIRCAYCGQPATLKIVSNPDHVCLTHALEFWAGLLDYAKHRAAPCVRHEGPCTCPLCEELAAAQLRRAAIEAAGPPPREFERVPLRLAS